MNSVFMLNFRPLQLLVFSLTIACLYDISSNNVKVAGDIF
jgi:hypothetical protein